MAFLSTVRSLVKKLASPDVKSYRIVSPGNVSAVSHVPQEIPKPDYNPETLQRLRRQTTIPILSEDDISGIREAGKIAKRALNFAKSHLRPGATTDEIDKIIHSQVVQHGAYPSPLHYRGYLKSCCTSVNNVTCHGIPDDCELVDGDVINVDVTVYYKGCHGDTSDTFPVGAIDEEAEKLIKTTQKCLELAIGACGPSARFDVIGDIIEDHAYLNGFSVCKKFIGHGIGSHFHLPPHVYHHRHPMASRQEMKEGMAFTIEPILMAGGHHTTTLDDGWTVVSKDGCRSAQSEHTILITKHGCEVLT